MRRQALLAMLLVSACGQSAGPQTSEAGPEDDAIPQARVRKDTVNYWKLEMPARGGRWEPVPIRADLDEILATLTNDFAWTLTPIA